VLLNGIHSHSLTHTHTHSHTRSLTHTHSHPSNGQVPRVLEAVFEPTLAMIMHNMEDFPDHRINFFNLLRAMNNHCFDAFFRIPEAHMKLVVDSIAWAFKHTGAFVCVSV